MAVFSLIHTLKLAFSIKYFKFLHGREMRRVEYIAEYSLSNCGGSLYTLVFALSGYLEAFIHASCRDLSNR